MSSEDDGRLHGPSTQNPVYEECERLLGRYVAENSRFSPFPQTIRRLVTEAKVLLVCEDLRRRVSQTDSIDHLLPLTDQLADDLISPDDLVETVRQRLFEPLDYSNRLKAVRRLFAQISRADYDRVIMRPARIKRKMRRN